ncbi:MAG TPA: trigger factor [Gammaproteobacteria bacterium]|nr:trigger factor [Gammaproteobacteria bacterium]
MAAEGYQVSVETAAGLERRLTIRVPSAEIEREISLRLAKVRKTAKLKGFRPGKVPEKVVRQYYGGQVRDEVLSDVIRASYSRAIAEQKLNPAGGPRIEALPGEKPGDQEHFTYRATFEVFPDIALKPLAELAIDVPLVTIEDADVDAMIQKLRSQRATWTSVDRKAASGDRAIVDFEGTIDGAPFKGSSGKEVAIVVGGGQVLGEFDAALTGAAAGDSRTASVAFPANYPTKDLAGKKAEFAIRVQRVEEQVLPALDDAFAASFGVSSGKVADLAAEVRKNMERELAERVKSETKIRVFDALIKANSISVPRALVAQEIQGMEQGAMRELGITDPARVPGRDRFQPLAERRVAVGLLIQELVREHKIRLDAARAERRIQELAAPYEKPQEAAQFYRSDRGVMAQVEAGVLEDQVVDFLLERAKKSDAVSTFKHFMGA